MTTSRFACVFVAFAAVLAVTACGRLSKAKPSDERQTVSVPIGVLFQSATSLVGNDTNSSFDLAAPSTIDFVIKITGCASGFTYTATSTTGTPVSSVNLYKGDSDCVAGLESYKWKTVSYTKSGGGTLSVGSAVFLGAGGEEMQGTVYVPLSNPIDATSKAHYIVAEIIKGADHQVPKANYSEPSDLIVDGLEAPNFTIYDAVLQSVASGTGKPTFDFRLECGIARAGSVCPTGLGHQQSMTDMKVALVYDDPTVYTTPNTMTYSQAQAIIVAGPVTQITAPMAQGFDLRGGAVVTGVVGEGPLDSKRNMFLVVEFTDTARNNAKSYRYFNVDLENPMN